MSFLKDIHDPSANDQELVLLYKKNADIRILGALYQRYMDLLYAVCLRYLKEPEASKDAVMGIFEELISKLKNHEVIYFKGWLYTVAKNYCLMQLRSQKQMPVFLYTEYVHLTDHLHLDGVFEKEENLSQLTKCMESLSSDQKQTIRLFYLQEKSYKEIAGIINTDWNRVRSLVQNARRNLKICMEKNGLKGKSQE